MSFRSLPLLTTCLGFAALLDAQVPTASYTFTGIGCTGSNGRPVHQTDGYPYLGNDLFAFNVRNTPASAPVALILAAAAFPVPVPLPGAPSCLIYNNPLLTLGAQALGSGEASVPLPVPNNSSLGGGAILAQFAVLDPTANQLGITTSNSGRGVVGVIPPIGINSASATTVGTGGSLSITGVGLGNNEGGSCFRITDAAGNTAFLLGTAITSNGGTDTAQMVMKTGPAGSVTGAIAVFRGAGGSPPVTATGPIGAPRETFVWLGDDPAGNMATGPRVTATPSSGGPCTGTAVPVYGTVTAITLGGNRCVQLTIPPCPTGRNYVNLVYDVHWNWQQCTGTGIARHYDAFMGQASIPNPGTTNDAIAFAMGFQLTLAFVARFGTALTFTPGAPGSGTINICPPVGVTCAQITGLFGNILLCCQ